jgi:hypothetical protein
VNPMIEVARSVEASSLIVASGKRQGAPFPDRAYDAVLCQMGLQFFSGQAARPQRHAASCALEDASWPSPFAHSSALHDPSPSSSNATGSRRRRVSSPGVLARRRAARASHDQAGFADISVTTSGKVAPTPGAA